MDGIDAVLAEFADGGCKIHASCHQAYNPETLAGLKRVVGDPGEVPLAETASLDIRVANDFARTANRLMKEAGIPRGQIAAIGSHGQTVLHSPSSNPPFTVQLGDPATLAVRTRVTVVGNFRQGDLALGGQGAPLVPAFHAYAFGDGRTSRAVLNLGGIANLTILTPRGVQAGFDTGPGNALLDGWCQDRLGEPWDADGAWAAGGEVLPELLAAMLAEPFFGREPPKSTGLDLFNRSWLGQHLGANSHDADPRDVQATLAELTATTIAKALEAFPGITELAACGGGALNGDLLSRLGRLLPGCEVTTTSEFGVPPQLVEATAIAWMARERLAGRPSNIPPATGARQYLSLGGVYLPPPAALTDAT